ncbi:DJ-1/PfpI family protein [Aspergillus puulaauensis]|uniref:DJ-1/PfpI domain-containing protein n=1 Tax=Aspergillus puulaauensis TaxID=1220207 RepID=A0A7R7XWK3_9EURO|nr:uncharacterized protein APUU_61172S [Aspergillus puulaauensis]BCS28124.1 hypothetical protein APUU_61172S [Aspergillus puulaauensis]
MKLTTTLNLGIGLLALSQPSSQSTTTNTTATPKNYGMLLFRGFEILDVFGPLEALSWVARRHDNISLSLISQSLDPVTTAPYTPAMNPFNASFFPTINPTHTLESAPELDVLIVPGGLGTRAPDSTLAPLLNYIKTTYPRLQYLITICTGSTLVARTGILDGKRATTNKASWASVIGNGPNTTWVREARWVVDGNVWSSSGISAGVDATLAFIAQFYGQRNASVISDYMEYEWHQDSSWDPYADIWA